MTKIRMPRPLCPCGRKFKARGLCNTHYRAALRGSPVWAAQMSDLKAPGAKYVYTCDAEECEVIGLINTSRAPTHHSRIVGVSPYGMGTHFCPEHYPKDRCRVCRRYMRPEHTPEDLWPETVSKGWKGKCHPCSLGMLEQIHTESLPTEEVKVIRRMIEERFIDPDDRLLVMSTLIGDDID